MCQLTTLNDYSTFILVQNKLKDIVAKGKNQTKEEWAAYMKQWRKNNPERTKDIHDRANIKWRNANRELLASRTALYVRKSREKLLDFFGGKCIICGFSQRRALELDHVEGDGYKFKGGRREFHGGENHNIGKFLRYIVENPDEAHKRFQLLCANCHRIKTAEKNEYCFKKRIGNWFPGMTNNDLLAKDHIE